MSSKWDYYWSVRDDALYIWEKGGVLIAKIDPEHFTAIIAELAEHLKWQETSQTKNNSVFRTNGDGQPRAGLELPSRIP